ncbi:MAG: aminoglycoside phosphotransferase family protein [Micropruina sp.]|uniref:aminoglycoside phosphotransferase family protein n=1 Tax=Micropruina sp. TaxID=2737536 RepID=UPI0039E3DCD6
MHPDQLPIEAGVVAALVADQFRRWRGLPIVPVPSAGTVNALFRIGEEWVARFPLQPDDPDAVRARLRREAFAAAELLGRVPFPTPAPIALGRPGPGYPLPWAVQTWLAGEPAWDRPLSVAGAADLAALVRALRGIEVAGRRFAGPGRGGDLAGHDAWVRHCLDRSAGLFDVPAVAALWAELRGLPRRASDVMAHSDLTPGNVLLDAAGRLTGVLDVGGFGPADPALDLMVAWTMLDAGPRQRFRDELDVDELDWQRSRGWALEQAVGLVWYYRESNPAMHRLGVRTLERLLTGTSPER